jgi:hypothetical protein
MTTGGSPRTRRSVAGPIVGVIIALVLGGIAYSQGESVDRAVGGVAVILVYVAALYVFSNRSETMSTLAGKPADERWESIHQRAAAATATIGAIGALAGFGITMFLGRESWQFAVMAAVLGLGYFGSFFWYRWRS